MAEGTKQERTLENKLLDKVGEAVSDISDAKHVDQVISAIHSVAVLLFPVDPSLFSGNQTITCSSILISPQSLLNSKVQFLGCFFVTKFVDISNSIAGSIGDKYRERVCIFKEILKCSTLFVVQELLAYL